MPGFSRLDLEKKIKEIYNIKTIPSLINNQITKFVRSGLTFLEIGRALYYYYEVCGNAVQAQYGIGIVPHVIDDARKWFEQEAARVQAQMEHSERVKKEGRNYDIICNSKLKKIERTKPFIDISSIGEEDNG